MLEVGQTFAPYRTDPELGHGRSEAEALGSVFDVAVGIQDRRTQQNAFVGELASSGRRLVAQLDGQQLAALCFRA